MTKIVPEYHYSGMYISLVFGNGSIVVGKTDDINHMSGLLIAPNSRPGPVGEPVGEGACEIPEGSGIIFWFPTSEQRDRVRAALLTPTSADGKKKVRV